MSLKLIILAELLRLYILGLLAMALLSIFTGVSWPALAAATSWWQLSLVPLISGVYVSLGISAVQFTINSTKRIASWICSHKA